MLNLRIGQATFWSSTPRVLLLSFFCSNLLTCQVSEIPQPYCTVIITDFRNLVKRLLIVFLQICKLLQLAQSIPQIVKKSTRRFPFACPSPTTAVANHTLCGIVSHKRCTEEREERGLFLHSSETDATSTEKATSSVTNSFRSRLDRCSTSSFTRHLLSAIRKEEESNASPYPPP